MVVRLIGLLLLPTVVTAQVIQNIRHEPFGNDIMLTYDLTGTLPSQQFLVKAVCQNGSQTIPLQHTEGNGLGQVRGGTNRQIIWHTLDDTPELVGDNITFTLTAVLIERAATTSRGDNSSESMRPALSLADRKAQLYNDLTSQTDTYLELVYNEITAFTLFGQRAFESRADFEKLNHEIDRVNAAYEKLLANKEPFRQQIRSLWGSEKLNADADLFFNRSLDQLHRTFLLPLNSVLKRMSDVASGQLKPRDRNELIKRIQYDIENKTEGLLQEINSLKGNARVFYTNLQQ
ncbi:hypothetical protein ACAW74_12925 [Fibrella sp. WM1]|uniref:hypothetical protein n=1 Tax=Fibrella musci TaxID=3242485 RepID=UPI003521FA76